MSDTTAYGFMMTKYEEAAAPLKEDRRVNDERKARRTAIFSELEVLQAKVNVFTRQAEELLADGEAGKAVEVKAQRQEAINRIDQLTGESESLRVELLAESSRIEHELDELAKHVVKAALPQIREMTLNRIRETIEYIEAAWDGLLQFERETRPCLSLSMRERLTPNETSPDPEEKRLARAVDFHFAGRDRIGAPLNKR